MTTEEEAHAAGRAAILKGALLSDQRMDLIEESMPSQDLEEWDPFAIEKWCHNFGIGVNLLISSRVAAKAARVHGKTPADLQVADQADAAHDMMRARLIKMLEEL